MGYDRATYLGRSESEAIKMRVSSIAAICLVILGGEGARALGTDPCLAPARSDSRVSLVLKSTEISKEGRFVATFELSNIGFNHKLSLSGKRENGTFTMDVPEISVQFLDLNNEWVSFTTLAGDFIAPNRLEIGAHSRGLFAVDLMSQEEANRSASNFRIMVRFFSPDFCAISPAFHAVPARQAVTGFEQSP
jgi:hypothetical protein